MTTQTSPADDAARHIHELFKSAWTLAAVSAYITDGHLDDPQGRVLGAAGLAVHEESGWHPSPELAALLDRPGGGASLQLAANLRQMAAAGSGVSRWETEEIAPVEVRMAAASQGVEFLVANLVPLFPDLAERFAGPESGILDTRTGTGEVLAAYCVHFPGMRAIGYDLDERNVKIANATLQAAGVADRATVIHGDVSQLDELDSFDSVRMPSTLTAPEVMCAALPRILRALRPGGWLTVQAPAYDGDELSNAIARWRVIRDGGTPDTPSEIAEELRTIGYTDVHQVTPPFPLPLAMIAARRPQDPHPV
ncbi:SAM-dependent methyltransferase [Nonomuraea sp. NPDC050556]|uniref:SAM-dependent methyltransferase n=1 Tax=Nonomuraea sp. NPDC050556 TaxID=3364369 RepID=UPI0037AD024E